MAVSSSPTEAGCGEGSLSSKPGNCDALPSSTETRCINSGTSRASGRRSDSLASWIRSLAPQSDSTYAISGFLLAGAEQHRYKAKMRRAEHRQHEFDAVAEQQRNAVAALQADLPQSRGDACGLLRDLAPRHPPLAADQRDR